MRSSWPRLAFSRDRAASADDDNADRFRQLLLPHLDGAYRYARFLCRDGAMAEDVVQEAFVRALKAIHQCHGDPRAWLFAIVRNCHHDGAKSRTRHWQAEEALRADDLAPDAENYLQQRDQIAHLRHTIASLPEPVREALVLREIEELSYRQIADITMAPIGTVMSRLARARQMLAALLFEEDGHAIKGEQA